MLVMALAAFCVAEATATPAPRPPVLRDAALAAAASAAVALAKPDIRRAILRDGRLSHVLDNFAHPVTQVRAGTRRDSDPFWINDVAHPASFALEGLYLKRAGYRDGAAFAFTQVHSVLWEFVVEGCAFEPSGKDLLADAAGAAAGIWVIHPLTRHWLHGNAVSLTVTPGYGGIALHVAATF
jgi:hypothetical protein